MITFALIMSEKDKLFKVIRYLLIAFAIYFAIGAVFAIYLFCKMPILG